MVAAGWVQCKFGSMGWGGGEGTVEVLERTDECVRGSCAGPSEQTDA